MILNAVSKAVAGALRASKPSLLQNEVAKVSGALAVSSEYTFSKFDIVEKAAVMTNTLYVTLVCRPLIRPFP